MKYIRIGIVLCVMLFSLSPSLFGQPTGRMDVEAVVMGPKGETVNDAMIRTDESISPVYANSEGVFTINVAPSSVLTVNASGYATKQIAVTADLNKVVLEYDENNYPVNVAYRKVDKNNLSSGISVVNPDDYLDKHYGSYPLDGVSAMIGGLTGGNLWGMDGVLVMIDGVPRSMGDVRTDEIDQITFLKGVNAVALYGSHAAKGVILITTKRGNLDDREIKIRATGGLNFKKRYPKYLPSAEYMTLYNEARENDGLEALYDDETIYNHYSGNNPYRYPDVDYYSSDYLKNTRYRFDVNGDFSGGNEKARFYTNLGFWSEDSFLNFGEAKNDNSNRFNVRGNVDLQINSFITSNIDVSAVFYNTRAAHGNYWGRAAELQPHRFAPLIPVDMIEASDEASQLLVENTSNLIDGKYLLGGSQQYMNNPFADIYSAGYNKHTSRQFQFTNGINFDLKSLTQGLVFRTNLHIDYSNTYNQSINNEYAVYQATWNEYSGEDLISSIQKFGEDKKSGAQNLSNSWSYRRLGFSLQFDYNRTFNNQHNVSALLVGAGTMNKETGDYQYTTNTNLGLQLGYNYKHKYFVDFSGALINSTKLARGNRTAFSPSIDLGWVLSQEDWLRNSSAVDYLKLNLSAGIINTDLYLQDFFLYRGVYAPTAWYSWYDGDSSSRATTIARGANPSLGFAKRKELNFGITGSFFDKLVTVQLSGFFSLMDAMPVQRYSKYPNFFMTWWPETSFVPYENYNADRRSGFDFAVNVNKKIGTIDWTLGIAGTYVGTKVKKREEMFEDAYQNRKGKPIDAMFGLVSDGFFKDQEDIDSHAQQMFGEVKPGDIKYVDQNGDGLIDEKDEVQIGRWGAPFTFGVHLTAKWKDFTFFVLGTGNTGGSALKNSSYHMVFGDRKYSAEVRNRWTEETKNTATYPRLTTLGGDNNFRTSDFWKYNTNRFDLAKVQITYNLPKRILQNSFVRELGFMVSGSNLFTVAQHRKIMEMNIGGAPQTRYFSIGVKAMF